MLKKLAVLNLLLFTLLFFQKVKRQVEELWELNQVDSYVLEIPKISLKKPFYLEDQEKNNLNYGIEVRKNSHSMLLMSHSGTGTFSYFHRLEELSIHDEFFILHLGMCSRYQIMEQHYKEKDGKLRIHNPMDDTVLLLTCSQIFEENQVYYVGVKR